ncbi:DNA-binding protein [Streptomyces sp. NPDC005408]|uniref:DNA-binding protein n=1 Tax=Streptomyces sp. NPDC005408 TaxID=3155341 RepID=UPI0033AC3BEB
MGQQPRTLLKVLVDQHRWRYSEFERQFLKAAERVIASGAGNPTVSETAFRRWTAGKLKGLPGPDTCRVLEALFGVAAADLFAPPPVIADPDVATFNLEAEIDMTAREAQDDAGATAAAAISDTTLDQLRDDVVSLARKYHTLSAYEVWRRARQLRGEAERARDRTQIPIQQQALLILAGEASGLLAAAAFDLGSLDGAKRLARTAALYGESARFDPLRAHAEGSLAYIAYFTGQPSQAASLARRALTYSGLGQVATRRLRAIEARAHGHLGDVTSARRAIQLSEEESQNGQDDLHDGVGGEFGFTAERLAMSNSSTALLIRDGQQAENAAGRALRLLAGKPPAQLKAPVLGGAATDLAMARLMRDDLDGAQAALETLWNVPCDQRVTGLIARVDRLRRMLAHPQLHGSPLAAELGERIEEFVRSSAQMQLGTQGLLALES